MCVGYPIEDTTAAQCQVSSEESPALRQSWGYALIPTDSRRPFPFGLAGVTCPVVTRFFFFLRLAFTYTRHTILPGTGQHLLEGNEQYERSV